MPKKVFSGRLFAKGILNSLPLALGYVPVAITFGILAKSYGYPSYLPIMMSLLIYAGSSQFVALQMMAMGTAPLQMVLTIFIVNIRHFLMGTTLTQRLPKTITTPERSLLAYFLTDEAFVYMTGQKDRAVYKFPFMLGFQVTLYIAWILGTVIGVFAMKELPPALSLSLGITIYALFLSLLVPAMKRSKQILMICILAGGLSYFTSLTALPTGWRIILVTIVTSLIGAVLIKEEVNG